MRHCAKVRYSLIDCIVLIYSAVWLQVCLINLLTYCLSVHHKSVLYQNGQMH